MFSMKSNKKEEPVMTTFHNENENQKKNFSIFMCQVLYEYADLSNVGFVTQSNYRS